MQRYGYQYDGLNRLLKGNYQSPDLTLPESHINDEALTYDRNGNIKTLVRNGKHGKYYTPIVIDNLGYQYTGNRVTNITDASGNSSGYEGGGQTITYDANGNTTAMPDKKISAIAYNFLNLPKQINQNTNVTNYYYRADGIKVRKRFILTNSLGTKVINTEYLDGFQYSTPNTDPIRKALENPDDATMEASFAGEEEAFTKDETRKIAIVADPGNPEVDPVMILSFFPTAEGYFDFENLRYIYQYKDHLGNVRLSYVKNGNDLQIMDRNDYYPFGMSFLKNNMLPVLYDPMAIPYNYKYNGKELQETGMYDYGWRSYMSDIGRWGSIDQLAEKFSTNSPYNYVGNNPILIFDPDGRDWYYTNNGQYLYNKGLNRDNADQFFKDNNIEGAKYAFEGNTMGSMHYAPDGYIYDNSEAGGGRPVENAAIRDIEGVNIVHPNAIAKRNVEAARYRLRDAEAQVFGRYAYGISVGYTYGNFGYTLTLAQNFGTGQAKLLGTTSVGLVKDSYGFNFQLNSLTAYGTNQDGSSYTDVFGGALRSGTEASASYLLGVSMSRSTEDRGLLPAPRGTTTTGINIGASFGGGISRTFTTDLTPALNKFLKFNWIQHKPQFD